MPVAKIINFESILTRVQVEKCRVADGGKPCKRCVVSLLICMAGHGGSFSEKEAEVPDGCPQLPTTR